MLRSAINEQRATEAITFTTTDPRTFEIQFVSDDIQQCRSWIDGDRTLLAIYAQNNVLSLHGTPNTGKATLTLNLLSSLQATQSQLGQRSNPTEREAEEADLVPG